MFKSTAFGLVRFNPVQNISLLFFDIETEYQVARANLTLGQSYQYAQEPLTKDIRYFNITIPTMRYYLNADDSLNINYERATNLAWLEWMYNIHKLTKPFLFDHPIYGTLKVRFAEALKIPKGIKGGQACVDSVGLRLIEVLDTATALATPLGSQFGEIITDSTHWETNNLFDFPHHTVSTEYRSEDTAFSLGGNYQYAVRGAKPEERTFDLQFEGLKYTANGLTLDSAVDRPNNMAYLEQFYYNFKLHKPFYYNHPVYGRTKVRFKEPLKIPKLRINSNGWTDNFDITLVEVIEDATRYV